MADENQTTTTESQAEVATRAAREAAMRATHRSNPMVEALLERADREVETQNEQATTVRDEQKQVITHNQPAEEHSDNDQNNEKKPANPPKNNNRQNPTPKVQNNHPKNPENPTKNSNAKNSEAPAGHAKDGAQTPPKTAPNRQKSDFNRDRVREDSLIDQIVEKIDDADDILVALSRDPTVDEMAAAIGLTLFLDRLGKRATAIYSGKTPELLRFLHPDATLEPNTDSLRDFIITLSKEKADHIRYFVKGDFVTINITPYKTILSPEDLDFSYGEYNVDLVLTLDVANESELDDALKDFHKITTGATIVNITTGKAGNVSRFAWADEHASSTSELVAKLVLALEDDEIAMDKNEATAFLTGIVAGTEHFANEKTSGDVLTLAAKLMDRGAEQKLIPRDLSEKQGSPAPRSDAILSAIATNGEVAANLAKDLTQKALLGQNGEGQERHEGNDGESDKNSENLPKNAENTEKNPENGENSEESAEISENNEKNNENSEKSPKNAENGEKNGQKPEKPPANAENADFSGENDANSEKSSKNRGESAEDGGNLIIDHASTPVGEPKNPFESSAMDGAQELEDEISKMAERKNATGETENTEDPSDGGNSAKAENSQESTPETEISPENAALSENPAIAGQNPDFAPELTSGPDHPPVDIWDENTSLPAPSVSANPPAPGQMAENPAPVALPEMATPVAPAQTPIPTGTTPDSPATPPVSQPTAPAPDATPASQPMPNQMPEAQPASAPTPTPEVPPAPATTPGATTAPTTSPAPSAPVPTPAPLMGAVDFDEAFDENANIGGTVRINPTDAEQPKDYSAMMSEALAEPVTVLPPAETTPVPTAPAGMSQPPDLSMAVPASPAMATVSTTMPADAQNPAPTSVPSPNPTASPAIAPSLGTPNPATLATPAVPDQPELNSVPAISYGDPVEQPEPIDLPPPPAPPVDLSGALPAMPAGVPVAPQPEITPAATTPAGAQTSAQPATTAQPATPTPAQPGTPVSAAPAQAASQTAPPSTPQTDLGSFQIPGIQD